MSRFHDAKLGGFFDHIETATGRPDGLKSYNSMVCVATSYLMDLALVDQSPDAPEYGNLLREIADRVVESFIDDSTGFLVENFDREWRPVWRDWQLQKDNATGRTWTISPVVRAPPDREHQDRRIVNTKIGPS